MVSGRVDAFGSPDAMTLAGNLRVLRASYTERFALDKRIVRLGAAPPAEVRPYDKSAEWLRFDLHFAVDGDARIDNDLARGQAPLFGLRGAVLVTLLAAVIVKSLAIARISHLMQLRWQDALPWRALGTAASCAVIATIPAFALARSAQFPQLPPLMTLPLAGLAYAITYAALCYAVHRNGLVPAVSASI